MFDKTETIPEDMDTQEEPRGAHVQPEGGQSLDDIIPVVDLVSAINTGNIDDVNRILKKMKTDGLQDTKYKRVDVLCYALKQSDTLIFETIMNLPSTQWTCYEINVALKDAAFSGNITATRILLTYKGYESLGEEMILSPKILRNAVRNNHVSVVDTILTHFPPTVLSISLGVAEAIKRVHMNCLQVIYEKVPDKILRALRKTKHNPLRIACRSGQACVVSFLLEISKLKLLGDKYDLHRSLYAAVKAGNAHIVDLLSSSFSTFSDIDESDINSCMEAAVRNGNVKIFAKLLAIYEYDLPDMTKETLPLYAIENGQIAILEYIVKTNHMVGFYLTADPKHCNRQDPLVHAVSRDNLDAVRLLVQIPSRRESSDISYAVKIALYGIPNVEIVKELISLPNFNAMQDDGKLLILCVKKGLPECLQLLLSTMLSVNDRTHSKLCKMADDLGNDAITEMLNKRPVRNASSWWTNVTSINLFIFATVLLPLLLICVVAIENRMTYRDVHYPSCIDKPNLEHANV